MALLTRSSLTIADTSLMTLSVWHRPNPSSNLLQMYYPDIDFHNSLAVGYDATKLYLYVSPKTDPAVYRTSWWFGGAAFSFPTSTWTHMLITMDTSLGLYGRAKMVFNGVKLKNYVWVGPLNDDFAWVDSDEPYNAANNGPFVFPVNGCSIGMPAISEIGGVGYYPYTPKQAQFADFQLWLGTYIDPTMPANFAKFVNITGGKGYPVDPSVAAAAFGTQTILFKGKASDNSFFVNRGNGGAFSKVGTASDFTPTPSY